MDPLRGFTPMVWVCPNCGVMESLRMDFVGTNGIHAYPRIPWVPRAPYMSRLRIHAMASTSRGHPSALLGYACLL
jgi:hypothetical protein